MNNTLLIALIVSLLLTLVLETGFFLLIGLRNKKDLLLVGLVNVVTNPAVVLLYWLAIYYTSLNDSMVKVTLELFAVAAEGYYFKKYGCGFKRPYFFSIAVNAFSYGAGILLQQFI